LASKTEREIRELVKRTDEFISRGIKTREKLEKEIGCMKEDMEAVKKEIIFERSKIESFGAQNLEKKLEKDFSEMNEVITDFVRDGIETREKLKNDMKIMEERIRKMEEIVYNLELNTIRSSLQGLSSRMLQLEMKANKSNVGNVLEKINELERKVLLMRSATPYVIE
jgi:ATP phosphoribosyltransferase